MSKFLCVVLGAVVLLAGVIQIPAAASEVHIYYASELGIIADGKTDVSSLLRSNLKKIESKGGGTVYFEQGTYVINQSIVLPSNISLIGNNTVFRCDPSLNDRDFIQARGKLGDGSDFIKDGVKGQNTITVLNNEVFSDGKAVIITGKKDDLTGDNNFEFNEVLRIEENNNIVLKYPLKDNYKANDGYSINLVDFKESINIKGIHLLNNTGKENIVALMFKFSRKVSIEDCAFTGFGTGTRFDYSSDVMIKNNQSLKTNTFTYLLKTKNSSIKDNMILDANIGIRVHQYCDFIEITNNTINNVTNHGLLYNDWNDNGIISGNTISNCGVYGLCHDKNNRYTLIEKNDISYTGKTALAVSSTIVDDCYIITRDNYIHDTESYGFTFEVVSYSEFTNNTLKNIGTDKRDKHGVVFIPKADNQSSNNIVANNTFENIYGECVRLYTDISTLNNTIRDNKFINSYRGVTCSEKSNNVIIRNNEFTNTEKGIVYSSNCIGMTISQNNFTNVLVDIKAN